MTAWGPTTTDDALCELRSALHRYHRRMSDVYRLSPEFFPARAVVAPFGLLPLMPAKGCRLGTCRLDRESVGPVRLESRP
ncbi:MAG: hypothetical protein JWO81_2146 [Alphaproteobacteria bacterium]|nr:hypothetical protein [Alphaproteobacteria bacterium]